MKKNIATILFLLFTLSAFSQNKTNDKDYYLQKSKKQKTVFYIFAGTGTGLIIAGLVLSAAQKHPDKGSLPPGILEAGGLPFLAISVPFFIASMKNKRKGMSLSFKNETAPQMRNNRFVYKPVPSLSLSIHL